MGLLNLACCGMLLLPMTAAVTLWSLSRASKKSRHQHKHMALPLPSPLPLRISLQAPSSSHSQEAGQAHSLLPIQTSMDLPSCKWSHALFNTHKMHAWC
jgi:hypothetical protein